MKLILFFSSWGGQNYLVLKFKRLYMPEITTLSLRYYSYLGFKNSIDCFKWMGPEKTSSCIKNRNSYSLGWRWQLMETLDSKLIPLPFNLQLKTLFILSSSPRVIICWLCRTLWKWLSLSTTIQNFYNLLNHSGRNSLSFPLCMTTAPTED